MSNIDYIIRNKLVEDITMNITKNQLGCDLDDFIQEIYVILLECKKLEDIKPKELKYFISRIIKNQFKSVTSNYYYKYKKSKINEISNEELFNEQVTD